VEPSLFAYIQGELMGNDHTRKTQAKRNRNRIRALLPHADTSKVFALADEPDPVIRMKKVLRFAIETQSTRATIDRCETAYLEALQSSGLPSEEARNTVNEFLGVVFNVDDKKYRPTNVDSTLTGVGRATGIAAKVIKSGKTVTDWQYRERTNRNEHD
jgi:hypothetical protein